MNSCAESQARNDMVKGAHDSFYHGNKCGESAQCECTINKGCDVCIDRYYKEGPGGVHYNIMMNPTSYSSMCWGMATTSKNQHFFTHGFYH
jgi:hypothetical protein